MLNKLSNEELVNRAHEVINSQEDATEIIQEFINREISIPAVGTYRILGSLHGKSNMEGQE